MKLVVLLSIDVVIFIVCLLYVLKVDCSVVIFDDKFGLMWCIVCKLFSMVLIFFFVILMVFILFVVIDEVNVFWIFFMLVNMEVFSWSVG